MSDNILDDIVLPRHCDYMGTDFSSETLCISYNDKKIYIFGHGELDEPHYYGGLSHLLFFYLFKNIKDECFLKIDLNIRIDGIDKFKDEYADHEIKDIYTYNRYFMKDNRLIICDNKFYSYHVYQGGILDLMFDDCF